LKKNHNDQLFQRSLPITLLVTPASGEVWALLGRGIGDFTENGRGVRAGGAGKIAGAVVESFAGQQGKCEGFFGVLRDAQAGRWNDFDFAESGGELRNNERIFSAASGDDELMYFCFGEYKAV